MPAPVCKPRFLQLAANALSDASFYDAPVCLQLNEFDEVQALVLKVMRSPGKRIVYPGCRFVVTGIFSEFHIREQPLWLWFNPDSAAQDGGLREGMRCTGNATDTTGATDRLAPSRGYFRRRTIADWLYAAALAAEALYALHRYGHRAGRDDGSCQRRHMGEHSWHKRLQEVVRAVDAQLRR